MADEFITTTSLASYPGVDTTNVSAGTLQLVVDLTNGLIVDLLGVPDPIPTKVKATAYEVGARALRNPEGYESVTRGVDDWKKTVRYSNAEALRAGVYLNDEEVTYLLGKKGVKRAKSISLGVPANGIPF
jgi:hypothetical protein